MAAPQIAVGRLLVILGADASALVTDVARAHSALGALQASTVGLMGLLARLGPAIAAVGFGALIKSSLDTIDAQSKMAFRLNSTVESIQALTYAADLAGVSQEGLTRAVEILNTRLGQAMRDGFSPAAEALRRVQLSARDLINLPVEERLARIGDQFQKLNLSTAAQSDTLRQLGIRSSEIINLFEEGGNDIRAAINDVRSFGVAVSDIDGITVERANDAWTRARLVLTGIFNQLSVHLAPLLRIIAERFSSAGEESGGFGDAIQNAVEAGVTSIGYLQRAVFDMRRSFLEWQKTIMVTAGALQFLGGVGSINVQAMLKGIETMRTATAASQESIKALGEPPDPEAWRAWWREQVALDREASLARLANRALRRRGETEDRDETTLREREALQERFLDLQRSLANEAVAQDIARQQELKKLEEFEQAKIGTKQQRDALRAAIDEKFNRDRQELVRTRLEDEVAFEDERLKRHYEDQLEKIREFEQAKAITEQQAGDLRKRYQTKFTTDMMALQARQWSGLANVVDTAMGNISAIVGKQGGAIFNVMKGLSIATALVKGYEAVLGAYAAGNIAGGPAVGAAFAAIAAAGVAAQIAAIAAVQPGDTGNVAAAPATAGGEATAAGGGGGLQQTLYFKADWDMNAMYSGESVRRMAHALIEYQKDGGKVVLAS